MQSIQRWRLAQVVLGTAWLVLLLSVAGLATAGAFAVLERAEAGKVAAWVLAHEARLSVLLGAAGLLLARMAQRRQQARAGEGAVAEAVLADATLWWPAVGLFATVVGYYAIQEVLPSARLGQSALSFGQWHAVSVGFFGLRALAAAGLVWSAWRRLI